MTSTSSSIRRSTARRLPSCSRRAESATNARKKTPCTRPWTTSSRALSGVRPTRNPSATTAARVAATLQRFGLAEHADSPAHSLSGGQKQLLALASILVIEPKIIVADEPISALDVNIQAQIINMLEKLQREMGLTYLFIAHDLAVVKHISKRIGVMYLGHLVEEGDSKELYANPMHPYTKALLSAVPIPDPLVGKSRKRIMLEGELPSPINPPSGCPFRTRCPYANEKCANEMPKMKEINGRKVACHMVG